jgi:DNA-binding PadR family transcriptional regulator
MSGKGLVEVDREETVDGRRRRYYRITGAGRRWRGARRDAAASH